MRPSSWRTSAMLSQTLVPTSICERRNSGLTWPRASISCSQSSIIDSGMSVTRSRVLRSTSRYSSSTPIVKLGSLAFIPWLPKFPIQRLVGQDLLEHLSENARPAGNALGVIDEVLADLDGNMGQAAALRVVVHRVVRGRLA